MDPKYDELPPSEKTLFCNNNNIPLFIRVVNKTRFAVYVLRDNGAVKTVSHWVVYVFIWNWFLSCEWNYRVKTARVVPKNTIISIQTSHRTVWQFLRKSLCTFYRNAFYLTQWFSGFLTKIRTTFENTDSPTVPL